MAVIRIDSIVIRNEERVHHVDPYVLYEYESEVNIQASDETIIHLPTKVQIGRLVNISVIPNDDIKFNVKLFSDKDLTKRYTIYSYDKAKNILMDDTINRFYINEDPGEYEKYHQSSTYKIDKSLYLYIQNLSAIETKVYVLLTIEKMR